MLEMLDKFTSMIDKIPFSAATWLVLGILFFFICLFCKAHRNPNSLIDWEHLILDTQTNRVSPYKLGFLVGVIVSTWIVITFSNTQRLTFDILGVYLTYLVGGVGVNNLAKKAVAKITEEDTSTNTQSVPSSTPTKK